MRFLRLRPSEYRRPTHDLSCFPCSVHYSSLVQTARPPWEREESACSRPFSDQIRLLYQIVSRRAASCRAPPLTVQTNLNNTIFLINYIRVFQQSGSQPLDQQVDVVSNLTGAGGAVGMTSVSSSPSRTTTISGSTAATGSGKASSAGEMRATTRALSLGLILALGASGGFCLLL
jgi:hypothetical protein